MKVCPGCRLELPANDWTSSPRRNASPECWQLYGEVQGLQANHAFLAPRVFQLTVDTYAAQHAGEAAPAIATAFALIGLHLALDRAVPGPQVRAVHQRLAATGSSWPRFTPPHDVGSVTVFDVALAGSADDHADAARRWATSVWTAWGAHHDEIAALTDQLSPRYGR